MVYLSYTITLQRLALTSTFSFIQYQLNTCVSETFLSVEENVYSKEQRK